MYQPGAPFYFFIYKYAGYDRFLQKDVTAFLAHLSQLRSTEDFFVGQGLGKVSDFKGSEFESVCSVDQVSFQALQFAYNQTPRCTFDRTGELKMAKNIATGTS